MTLMLERRAALELVKKHVAKENNIKHMIAVGGIMRSVATRLGEDADRWELVGILHDIDYEVCSGPEDHTVKAKELLRQAGATNLKFTLMHSPGRYLLSTEVVEAIKANLASVGIDMTIQNLEWGAFSSATTTKLEDTRMEASLNWWRSINGDADSAIADFATKFLPPGNNTFDFAFTALSLSAPEKQRFKYRLDPYDATWVDAGTRRHPLQRKIGAGMTPELFRQKVAEAMEAT